MYLESNCDIVRNAEQLTRNGQQASQTYASKVGLHGSMS